MKTLKIIIQVLVFPRGLYYLYTSVILIAFGIFPSLVEAQDTTLFSLTYNAQSSHITVYSPQDWGATDSLLYTAHVGNKEVDDEERLVLYRAYVAARLNPFLVTMCSMDTATAFQNCEMIPYIKSMQDLAVYDSVALSFPYQRGMHIFYLSSPAWVPLPTYMTINNDGDTLLEASIYENGFYMLMGEVEKDFPFDALLTSYPNPFDPRRNPATITYLLQYDTQVEMNILSRTGALVATFTYMPGKNGGRGSDKGFYLNKVTWDGRNRKGRLVENGGYLCRLIVKDKYTRTWKIGVLR